MLFFPRVSCNQLSYPGHGSQYALIVRDTIHVVFSIISAGNGKVVCIVVHDTHAHVYVTVVQETSTAIVACLYLFDWRIWVTVFCQ
jgi:hypothetical protein